MSITGLPGNIPHQGLKERNPPELHISKVRGPTSTDSGTNFDIGDIWIDLLGDDAYILVSKDAGVAIWILMSSVSGTLSFLTGDVGGAVGPDGGANINIIGGNDITTTGNPGTNTITIDASSTVAVSFPVDDGGPGVPLSGAISILGRTSTDFPNPSGIETHVGATTNEIYLENRRFLSDLVVDPSAVIGLRGEFTTITTALAAAVSGQTIYIRPGTYTEDLTLVTGVNLIGATTSGGSDAVIIVGSITADYTGTVELENLTVSPAAGDAIISVGGVPTLECFQCEFRPGAGTVCSSANSNLTLVLILNDITSAGGFDLFAPTAGSYEMVQVFTTNGATDRILVAGTSSFNVLGGRLNHQIETTGTGDFFVTDSLIFTAALEAFNVNSAGSSISFTHITVTSNAGSGNFVIGTGTINYANVVNLGSAQNISGTIIQVVNDWKPYGLADDSTVGVNSYASVDFTVNSTTGVVSLAGASGFIWREETGTSSTFVANEGIITNNAGLVTLTLPATCTVGDVLRVAGKGVGGWEVAQIAGQTIHFGNQDTTTGVGGSSSSTNQYDSVELLCITTDTDYVVLSSLGNVTIN